ncbi:MAG: hypothetical protein AB7O57_03290 [Hyphomicrobiaceae bacterium]
MSQIRTPKLDFTQMDCLQQAKALLNAYTRMLSGGQRTEIRHGDYWTQYRSNSPADMAALRDLYQQIRQTCPAAQSLPDLSPGARVRRGPARPLIIGG